MTAIGEIEAHISLSEGKLTVEALEKGTCYISTPRMPPLGPNQIAATISAHGDGYVVELRLTSEQVENIIATLGDGG